MKHAVLLALGIILGWTALPARADTADYARPGAYVGGGILGAIDDTDIGPLAGGLGVDTRAGYRLFRHLALEGQLTYINSFRGSLGVADVDLQALTGTANVKAFPFTGRVQPYAQAGLGATYLHGETHLFGNTVAKDSSTEFTFRGGGGLDLYLRPSVSLYTDVSYILLSGDLGGGFIPFTFGAQYHF